MVSFSSKHICTLSLVNVLFVWVFCYIFKCPFCLIFQKVTGENKTQRERQRQHIFL